MSTNMTTSEAAASSTPDVAAIGALVHVLEAYGPVLTHRAALRCEVGRRLLERYDSTYSQTDLRELIAVLALTEIDLAVSGSRHLALPRHPARASTSADTLAAIAGLEVVAASVRHVDERWDGYGGPDGLTGSDIAQASQIFAICDALVANPAIGFTPSWTEAMRSLHADDGRFNPALVDAAQDVDLSDISATADRVGSIMTALGTPPPRIVSAPPAALDPNPSAKPQIIHTANSNDVASQRTQTNATASIDRTLRAVLHVSEPHHLLGLMLESLLDDFDAEAASFLQLAPSSSDLIVVAQRGNEKLLESSQRELLYFDTLSEISAGVPFINGHHVAVSVVDSGVPWGVLSIARQDGDSPFAGTDIERLGNQAHQATLLMSVGAEWAEIERMATRDQLTGLANRHELNRVIDEIFTRPASDRRDAAVIMCDVDGLKNVNDTYGHDAGDQLLIDAAAALRAAVRDPDRTTLCRIGGDEFCVVIDGGALLTAYEISDTIERLFARSGGSDSERSISCGLAFADEETADRSALLKAADENQYDVKRTRRAARGEPVGEPGRRGRRARR